MTIAPAPRTTRTKEIYYPTGDGKPVAEDSEHVNLIAYHYTNLTDHFADRPDVYISANDFVYYDEGNPRKRLSPDCYVVIGVEKKYRPYYKIWENDGIAPAIVFKFTSPDTWRQDLTKKKDIY